MGKSIAIPKRKKKKGRHALSHYEERPFYRSITMNLRDKMSLLCLK